jgi:hypothetical protein
MIESIELPAGFLKMLKCMHMNPLLLVGIDTGGRRACYSGFLGEYETSTISTSSTRNEPTDKTWITWPGTDWRIPTGVLPNGNLR